MPKKSKLIIDTNIWISFLISKRLRKLDSLFNNDKITFVFSNELISEFIEVAARPKFKKYFDREDVEKILDIIDNTADIVKVKSKVNKCRDEKDNFLLALAKDSKADYLLTGDDDLLVLKKFHATEIITYTKFASKF